MKLTLEGLRASGSFSGRPVPKDITWKQGDDEHTGTVYVRAISFQTAMGSIAAHVKKSDPNAERIAASICDEQGAPIFTAEDVTGEADPERGPLDGNLVIALLVAIGEVQNAGKTKA